MICLPAFSSLGIQVATLRCFELTQMNKKTLYYDMLVSLCKDFEERVNRGGNISEVAVEELFVRRKYARQTSLVMTVTVRLGGRFIGVLAKESSWWLKKDFYNELRESLCQRIIHNYFVFGLGRSFREKSYQYMSAEELVAFKKKPIPNSST
jgi:hypothetical protein